MKKNLLLIIASFIPASLQAQSIQWVSHFDNGTAYPYDYVSPTYEPVVHNVTTDAEGNIYICGYSKVWIGGGGDNDIAIVKYNSSGTELWHTFYPDTGGCNFYCGESPRRIALDDSDNVYVFGNFKNGSADVNRFLTLKFDSAGTLQWTALHDTGGYDLEDVDMAVSPEGNVYVCGIDFVPYPASNDVVILKYNRDGEKIRTRVYNGYISPVSDRVVAIALDANENVYLTASGEYPGQSYDYLTIAFDSTISDSLWVARYNGAANGTDNPLALFVDSHHNVYVTGESAGSGTYNDFATVKYDSLGVEQWAMRYDFDSTNEKGRAIVADASGNVYVTGSCTVGTTVDYVTIKYNSTGTELWARRNTKGFSPFDLDVSPSGDVYVTGYTDSVIWPYDVYTIRYNSAGVQTWESAFNDTLYEKFGYEDEVGWDMLFDYTGDLIVYAQTRTSTALDLTLIKYSTSTSVSEINSFDDVVVSPNPVLNKLTIGNWQFTKSAIEIYNVLGEKVYPRISELRTPNSKLTIDVSFLPRGIYILQIYSGEKIFRKKLVKE